MKGFQKTIDWYNKYVDAFAATRKKAGSSYDISKDFENFLPKGGKILDAGCGPGRDVRMFTEHGFDVTGIDISDGLINEAKKEFPEGKFLVGDMRALPFKDNDFDGIWSSASLLHFETREDVLASLQEFYRVVRAKGIVYVSVKLQTGEKKFDWEKDERYDEPRFFQYFTEKEIRELFKEAKLDIIDFRVEQSKSRANIQWIQVIGRKNLSLI